MRKILSILLAVTCTFGLGLLGCNNNKASEDGLKIVIVSSPSGVDDASFNQNNYDGILAFIAKYPNATVTAVREVDVNKSIAAVEAVVADYDVIVTPGFQFAGVYDIAIANPDKFFILVDCFPVDENWNEVTAPNIYAMQFAEQESGFFAGITAAMQTETGKVASVHGIAYPSNVNYQWGFESGVHYANKYLGTNAVIVSLPSYAGTDVTGANVGGNYVGDFSNETGGKEVGEALLDQGVDIIFVAAGASGNGVFTAVKERGNAFVIGCDVDQFSDGANGDSNIVLTSALKVMAPNVTLQLEAIQAGTFEGGNFTLTASTDSTGFVSTPGRHQLT
ncbi:MAG: BMP family ABC transporter substrate-binding protein, partial [Coriobacteriia bacterium]|nr:BMP family ABC transporter substrate-binding protein [Coriobacteriia bacterium]